MDVVPYYSKLLIKCICIFILCHIKVTKNMIYARLNRMLWGYFSLHMNQKYSCTILLVTQFAHELEMFLHNIIGNSGNQASTNRSFSNLSDSARKNISNVFTLLDVRVLHRMESLPIKISIGQAVLYVASVVYLRVYQ